MSVQDQIVIQSHLDPKSTLKTFAQNFGINDDPYSLESHPLLPIVGITESMWTAHAYALKGRQYTFIKDSVGFPANVNIAIFPDKFQLRKARHEWLVAILNVIEQMDWDLAWVHGDSHMTLMRKSGMLMLREGNNFWRPENIKVVTMDYTFAELPNL